ncbi:MAG TPA: hypothetical protein VL588_10845 [Bdellovibrionota bacterium]|jgi:hypothetical protein|nr:hypothetical protein [Bdellovibrionota bacterium]
MKSTLNRQKYLQIASEKSLDAALTTLHRDMLAIENESFEGSKGWQPDLWSSLKEWRAFSQELWAMRDPNEAMGPRVSRS